MSEKYISKYKDGQEVDAALDSGVNSEIELQKSRKGLTKEYPDIGSRLDFEIGNAREDVTQYNCTNLLNELATYTDKTSNGITYTWNEHHTECRVAGTTTGSTSFSNILVSLSSLPSPLKPGGSYPIKCTISGTQSVEKAARLAVYFYKNGNTSTGTAMYVYNDTTIEIPDNCTGIVIRLQVSGSGRTVDVTFSGLALLSTSSNNDLKEELKSVSNQLGLMPNPLCVKPNSSSILPNNTDLNERNENLIWLVNSDYSYFNLPPDISAGFLFVVTTGGWTYQEVSAFSGAKVYKRRGKVGGSWTDWFLIGDGGSSGVINNYNNSYSFNEYSNSYNVSATPQITSDSNNFLSSTGDNTDVTASIVSMLTLTGICHLGTGVFYVSGVDMPDDTQLIGSGPSTKVILLGNDSTEGYAIKMGSRCTVKDMSIMGSTEDYTSNGSTYPSDLEYVARHGILWQGNASGANDKIPRRGTVSNCYISNFTGGGITCYDTGLNVISGINVSDCFIWHCYAGINIEYYSEFSRWNNISVNMCHYGAVNNGGNQSFSNCGFSKNIVGMIIDNSNGQSKNNSHGSVCNCIFDHSDNNVGIGIELLGVTNGELFSNCQLFYSSISVDNCKGVSFTNFDYGRSKSSEESGVITVNNNSFVIFDKFICREVPPVTVDSSSKAKFINCYTWEGTSINP